MAKSSKLNTLLRRSLIQPGPRSHLGKWRCALYSLSSSTFTNLLGSKVVNPRAALLSNYEVLTLLRELESDHLARTKAAIRVKKEEEAAQIQGSITIIPGTNPQLDVSENLRTMEVEVGC